MTKTHHARVEQNQTKVPFSEEVVGLEKFHKRGKTQRTTEGPDALMVESEMDVGCLGAIDTKGP